ncbi:hypothetical protein DVH24_015962 [Malus domestica]|uniref:Uncharacterized protein n=1 Tax=Malus domestica TaxID=3750 RepID=A0A498JGA0_MALDO|nr:hypothetical protein DVH24_015962 [Malus domestica]
MGKRRKQSPRIFRKFSVHPQSEPSGNFLGKRKNKHPRLLATVTTLQKKKEAQRLDVVVSMQKLGIFWKNFDTLNCISNIGLSTSSGTKSGQMDEFWISVTSRPRADHFSGPLYHRSTILSIWAPITPSHRSPILGVLWPPSHLTSEFRRNLKPVSSQKALC